MFGTERRLRQVQDRRPRFNKLRWFLFGAPHVYQRDELVAKTFAASGLDLCVIFASFAPLRAICILKTFHAKAPGLRKDMPGDILSELPYKLRNVRF